MTDILLVCVLAVLVLNGDWPVKVSRYVKVTVTRWAKKARLRRKNARAVRRKKQSDVT